MWCYDVPSCQQRQQQTPFFVTRRAPPPGDAARPPGSRPSASGASRDLPAISRARPPAQRQVAGHPDDVWSLRHRPAPELPRGRQLRLRELCASEPQRPGISPPWSPCPLRHCAGRPGATGPPPADCSSDAWMGDSGSADNAVGWNFRGQRLIAAMIQSLVVDQGMGARGFGRRPARQRRGGACALPQQT